MTKIFTALVAAEVASLFGFMASQPRENQHLLQEYQSTVFYGESYCDLGRTPILSVTERVGLICLRWVNILAKAKPAQNSSTVLEPCLRETFGPKATFIKSPLGANGTSTSRPLHIIHRGVLRIDKSLGDERAGYLHQRRCKLGS
ncbi:hypothetical protein FHL15_004254 [Xylaria flabelliformis]|uniref:Uncharacterized protein n=1 Tax=Xylaria flabelliformis TaxID=2512241 RepID=A0A553I3M2_9PEZI|nr:hypothetical protein FHL15_004254 [Xylaria flabelliformis]